MVPEHLLLVLFKNQLGLTYLQLDQGLGGIHLQAVSPDLLTVCPGLGLLRFHLGLVEAELGLLAVQPGNIRLGLKFKLLELGHLDLGRYSRTVHLSDKQVHLGFRSLELGAVNIHQIFLNVRRHPGRLDLALEYLHLDKGGPHPGLVYLDSGLIASHHGVVVLNHGIVNHDGVFSGDLVGLKKPVGALGEEVADHAFQFRAHVNNKMGVLLGQFRLVDGNLPAGVGIVPADLLVDLI